MQLLLALAAAVLALLFAAVCQLATQIVVVDASCQMVAAGMIAAGMVAGMVAAGMVVAGSWQVAKVCQVASIAGSCQTAGSCQVAGSAGDVLGLFKLVLRIQ